MRISTTITATSPLDEEAEFRWARQHAAEADGAEPPSPWPAILAEYGSEEAWLAACRERRNSDTDRPLARAIMMLTKDAPGRPRGKLRPPELAKMMADKPLMAYWASVIAAGDEGWAEEHKRVGRSDVYRVVQLLPLWRNWGQVLLSAGAVEIGDGSFMAAG